MWRSTAKRNITIVQRFFAEHWDTGSSVGMDLLLGPNHQHHFSDGETLDREGVKQLVRDIKTALPDIQTAIDDIFAADDKVVVRFTIQGTHLGEGMGLPPTGKQVKYTGIDIFRLTGGKIVERWGEVDTYGLLRQLGVIPEGN